MYIITLHCYAESSKIVQKNQCLDYSSNIPLQRTSNCNLDTSSTKKEKSKDKSTKNRCIRIDHCGTRTIFAFGKSCSGYTVDLS